MGYINSAVTTNLIAKLTPLGRKKFIMTNNNLVTSFAFGDSDANYYTSLPLTTGQVPGDGGDVGPNNSISNTVAPNVAIKNYLIVDNLGSIRKPVEPQSNEVVTEFNSNGQVIVSGSYITQNIVDRTNINTDSLVNLFYSFNLPLNSGDDYNFTQLTYTNGGFSDTALSAIAQDQIVVIALDNSLIGELTDGKSIKVEYTSLLSESIVIYSTYQNSGLPLANQDANYTDVASTTSFLGPNIALLFSDTVQKPNNNPSLSWATGYNTVKPFSLNSKSLYNFQTNTNFNENVDVPVGIAYLDKGFIVLTNPYLVTFFNIASTAKVTLNTLSTSVVQNITCIANRGEFANSTNPTFEVDDVPRISEVGLYDTDNDLIAIAKLDRQLVKGVNEFLALNIKIVV